LNRGGKARVTVRFSPEKALEKEGMFGVHPTPPDVPRRHDKHSNELPPHPAFETPPLPPEKPDLKTAAEDRRKGLREAKEAREKTFKKEARIPLDEFIKSQLEL